MLEPKPISADRLKARQGANRVVRVSLPATVGSDLAKFQKIQKDILGRLGCMACCSGWDIRWDMFNDFRVDERLNVEVGAGF
jgi:hypothetical protein